MSDYLKMNIKEDLEDAAPGFGLGDHLEARFGRKAMDLQQFGFSYQKFEPNYRQGFGHVHKEQEELYLVIGGGGRVKVADEILELRQWDALRVEPGVTRQFEAGENGLEYIAIGGAPTGDAEMINDWWVG
jgi:mannose-6-phosphate isomerase-like protein (cupin superfamily)